MRLFRRVDAAPVSGIVAWIESVGGDLKPAYSEVEDGSYATTALEVEWPDVGEIILSEKDKKNPTLAVCKMEF